MNDELAPVQRWYVDELNHLGEHGKAAKYKVDVFSIAASRRAIIDVHLDGDVNNIFNPDVPKRIKEEWNELGVKSVKLTNEAMNAKAELGGVVEESINSEDLPMFLKEDGYMTRKAMKLMSSGWYQNSSGELYHYDGVVWDNVPSVKIDDLEFLGG